VWIHTLDQAVGGPSYLRLVAALALFAAVPGLNRGTRSSWWLAILAASGSALGHRPQGLALVGSIGATLLVVLLLALGNRFRAPSDLLRVSRGIRLIAFGEIGVLLYGIAGLYLVDVEFREPNTLARSIKEALRLLILLPSTLSPISRHGAWLLDSVRWLSLVVVLIGAIRLVAPAFIKPARRAGEMLRVRQLLALSTTPLAHFHLLDDKTWFFSQNKEAFISYKLVGRVAMVLGGPVGYPRSQAAVVKEFAEYCDRNGLLPGFYQVADADRPLLEEAGFKFLKIGEEAVIPLQEFSLVGRPMKEIRSACRRVERAGCQLEVLEQPIDDQTMAQLKSVSDAWLGAGHRERTYTVGQFNPAYLRETKVFAVRGSQGRIVAFANLLPSYGSDYGTFDLMRRLPDAPNGVMDYLHVALIEHYRNEGMAGLALGMAALKNLERNSPATRALKAVRDLSASFHFSGVYKYKNKWKPRWEPRYLAYLSELHLPRMAVAVTQVGEISPALRSEKIRAAVRRFPFTTAMLGLTLWLCTMVYMSPEIRVFLVNHFGLSWPDLIRLRLWKLVSSPLTPPGDGTAWSPFIFAFSVVPLAEWRFGTSRAIKSFFLGDWLSSLPVLVMLRIAGHLGAHAAFADTILPDSGASAGGYALVAALAATIPHNKLRYAAYALIGVTIAIPMALNIRVFDFQHIIACSVGILLARRWTRPAARSMRPEAREPGPVLPTMAS
jgi:phosphatidylglycerol lysyltransferase